MKMGHSRACFRNDIAHHGLEIAGFLVNTQLAVSAGAFVHDGADIFNSVAAAEIVDDVINKLEQFMNEFARGDFRFLAKVNELAFDAVASRAPLVLFDEGAAIQSPAHVALVEAMKLDDDGLAESGDGDGFIHFCANVEQAELKSAEGRVGTDVPPDFFAVIDAIELDEEVDEIFVRAPGFELFGNAGARKTAEDGGAEGFEARVPAHPEGRTGGKRKKVRKEIADAVHHVDGGLLIGHGDVDVHAEDQKRAGELAHLFDDVLVAFAGRDDLIDPTGKRMGSRGGDLEVGALGGGHEFSARTIHVRAEFRYIFADAGAGFDDGLVKLMLHLFGDTGGDSGNDLADVGTKLARGWVNDLEFFLDTDGEAVRHNVSLRQDKSSRGLRG